MAAPSARFRFDAADTPAHDAQAVDHGGVTVWAAAEYPKPCLKIGDILLDAFSR
ncbi:MAG: hypothetical protein R3C20_10240 [Planctomycetaceae bacterium]